MIFTKGMLIKLGLFLGGTGVGFVGGWIFGKHVLDKKYEAMYLEELDRQVSLYKAHLSQPRAEAKNDIPKDSEQQETKAGASKSSLEGYSARKVDDYTPYSKMYRDNPVEDDDYHIDISNEIDSKEDSKAVNTVGRGGTVIPEAEFDDATEEDRVELFYYVTDDILATEDNEIVDQDELFGDALAEFRANDDPDICATSAARPGTYYMITKMAMSFNEVTDHG